MSNSLQLLLVASLLQALFAIESVQAQQGGAGTPAMPGTAIRERNRQMDEYDKELERLRNGASAPSERRRNLFPQINEDFQKIQVIHNELVRMIQGDKNLNYDRVTELTSELKKRGNRLRNNLALPDGEDVEESRTELSEPDDAHIKASLVTLHDLIVSFVSSPLFKNLALLDAKVVTRASSDLRSIVQLSEEIKKSTETLGKTARK